MIIIIINRVKIHVDHKRHMYKRGGGGGVSEQRDSTHSLYVGENPGG